MHLPTNPDQAFAWYQIHSAMLLTEASRLTGEIARDLTDEHAARIWNLIGSAIEVGRLQAMTLDGHLETFPMTWKTTAPATAEEATSTAPDGDS